MSKRIVYTINPNDGKYMRDDDEITDSLGLYQGIFKYVPIFPLYTINCDLWCPYIKVYNEDLITVEFIKWYNSWTEK